MVCSSNKLMQSTTNLLLTVTVTVTKQEDFNKKEQTAKVG